MKSNSPALRIILLTSLTLFLSEAAIMGLFAWLGMDFNPWVEALLDASFVTLVSAPICYFWIFPIAHAGIHQPPRPMEMDWDGLEVMIAKFGLVIFSVETAVMLSMPFFWQSLDPLLEALVDAFSLTLFSSPITYFWVMRAMHRPGATPRLRSTSTLFLNFFPPAFVALSLLMMVLYETEMEAKQSLKNDNVAHHVEMVKGAIMQDFEPIVGDLLALSRQADLEAFLAGDHHAGEELLQDYATILATKEQYGAIGFIPDEPDGTALWYDRLPVQRNKGADFFRARMMPKTMKLNPDEIFVSSYAAVSGGSLSLSLVYLATPHLSPEGEKRGIMVLAVYGSSFGRRLKTNPHGDVGHLVLMSADGSQIISSSDHDQFTSLGTNPALWSRIASEERGQIPHEDTLITFFTLHPPLHLHDVAENSHTHGETRPDVSPWKLVSLLPDGIPAGALRAFRSNLLLLYGILIALTALGMWNLAKATHRRIQAEVNLAHHASKLEETVKERTKQLVHAERLASLGTFSAGMAHEVNNPNSFISGNVQFLQLFWQLARPILERHGGEDPSGRVTNFLGEVEETLAGILDGSHRIKKIIDSLKTYSKGGMEADKVDCRLLDPVNDALSLLRHRIKQGVTIEVQVPPDLTIHCDRQQVSQVFVNLINNALDAMEGSGMGDEKRIRIQGDLIDNHVWARVIDNGPGIPDQAVGKIFDPFYTTKGKTKGTGLGLAIVHGIIEDHKGQITVFSAPGQDTEFLFILPSLDLYRQRFGTRN